MRSWASGPQRSCDHRTEGEHPTPDALIGDHDAPLSQEFFNIAEAEREAQIHPHGTLDDLRREAIARVRERAHAGQLRRRDARGKLPNVTTPSSLRSRW